MGFFNSLPVPELREWNYPFPFPFPNSQMSFPLTPVRVYYYVKLFALMKLKSHVCKLVLVNMAGRLDDKIWFMKNFLSIFSRMDAAAKTVCKITISSENRFLSKNLVAFPEKWNQPNSPLQLWQIAVQPKLNLEINLFPLFSTIYHVFLISLIPSAGFYYVFIVARLSSACFG